MYLSKINDYVERERESVCVREREYVQKNTLNVFID